MKKMEINRGLRGFLYFFVIALIVVSGFFINKELKKERFREEVEIPYTYESSLNASQSAKVVIGKIYNKDTLKAGELCIGQLIKGRMIDLNISYRGKSSEETVSGEYVLKALVTGRIQEGENAMEVWNEYVDVTPLVKFANVLPDENGIVFRDSKDLEETIIKLEEIVEFKKLQEPIVNNIGMELVADVKIETDTKEVENAVYSESHQIRIDIPQKIAYYRIPEDIQDIKSSPKEVKKRVEIPLNHKLITFMSILAGIGGIGLITLIIFTRNMTIDKREEILNKIFKNHGDNMVALIEEDENMFEGAIRVKDIKDLVRVGEELIRPILYKHDEDQNKIENFYIINKDEIYLYRVEIGEEKKGDNDIKVEVNGDATKEIAVDIQESAEEHEIKKQISGDTAILEKDDVIVID